MKIKVSLLLKWCTCKLTKKEYEFLIFIARYQDCYGHVRGIYYKDIMENCSMSQMTFYTILRSLKQKGLIDYKRMNKDYDITILNNDFSYEGSWNEGYINLNKIVFEEEKFKKLRVNEKILLMIFMRNTYVNKGIYRVGTNKFYDDYTKLLGVTKKVLRSYLHSLKEFFNIWTQKGKYFIKFVSNTFKEKSETETDQYLGHIVQIGCRRNKVVVDSTATVKDTMQLIKQYRQQAKEAGQNIFEVLNSCLAECKNGILNSKYIHKLIRQAIGIEYRPAIEA